MPEKPWKRAERQVAQQLGGERVKRHGEASPGVVTPHLVVKVKLRKDLPAWIISALLVARSHAKPSQLPLAVLKEHGTGTTLVVMHLPDFEAWFGPITAKKEAP